jgi:hypothetical protein
MSEQQKYEIIKALAYGETPEKIAEINSIDVATLQEIQQQEAAEIAIVQQDLRKAGYLQ